jgi:hypothetical protein
MSVFEKNILIRVDFVDFLFIFVDANISIKLV